MAEQGGKMFSVQYERKSGKKASAKRQVSPNGKDGSKTARVRKGIVASDSEGSVEEMPNLSSKTPSKSGGKPSFEAPSFKDLGKGGKADATGKAGGKTSTPVRVTTEKVELKIEDELPKNARCLMDCEAADILQRIQEHISLLSDDPTIKAPEHFLKGLQYAQCGTTYKSSQAVRQSLEFRKLKRSKVSEGEICVMANTCPETVDEAFALLPSLEFLKISKQPLGSSLKLNDALTGLATKVHNEGPIKGALVELAALKESS